MDNSAARWSPSVGLVAAGWLLAALAAGGTVSVALSGDRPGIVLLGVATVALLAAATHGTIVRPRLAADAWGVRLRMLTSTRELPWREVQMRLTTTRRLGRDVTVLEFESRAAHPGAAEVTEDPEDPDAPPDLMVLGRLELGKDPRDVHDHLVALRTGSAGQGR